MKTKSGRVLSEKDLDDLVLQAEKGFDLSTWKRRPGRPPLGGPGSTGTHSPRIAVRVSSEVRQRAATRAAKEGRSLSEVVRALLEGYADGIRGTKTTNVGQD